MYSSKTEHITAEERDMPFLLFTKATPSVFFSLFFICLSFIRGSIGTEIKYKVYIRREEATYIYW